VTTSMDEHLKLSYEKEIQRPFTDSLTGFYNHGLFQIFLDHEIKRSQRYSTPFTLGLVDIDSFSFYNKRHGALQGDRMLQKIAEVIKMNIRQADLAARYSGDVFAVLLEAVDSEAALAPVERIRYLIAQSADIPLTVSIGLASFPRDADNKGELLRKAEAALYQAKIRGENKVYLFEKEKLPPEDERPKVLIVDDDPRSLKLLETLLAPLHADVITATNGNDSLHVIDKVEVDLVVLDVMMSEMDGFEVCRRLKENEATRMIPVILITALDDMQSKVKGIKAGADDFITKPPNKVELLARTQSLIRLKKLNNNLTSIENVLFSLANSVEAKDVSTQGHIERVSNIAIALGKKMGLSAGKIEALRFGGVLHDIGKLGVPGDLLNKPKPLSSEENELMKRHPEIGYKICLPLKRVLGPALDVIRHHHEKLDGSGYPDGLKGNEISIEARIMAVTDMYDALITDRPYRKGLPKKKVLEILHQEALEGKLDQKIVEHLGEIVTREDENEL
jgi:putative two-component system response regulator